MSNAHYKIYQQKNLSLNTSLFIHTPLIAEVINNNLREYGYEVLEDPLTWKYYHNISGNYHYRDIEMTIVSHDTLEEIVFSKENLDIHRGTKLDYLSDDSLVRSLISRYPDQEMLIRRILNPIDPELALRAPEGTILYHDASLVESNEIDLMEDLQGFVYRFFRRWNVNRHSIIDDLAPAAFLGILYTMTYGIISNIRKSKCLTRQAHSYHIREYLRSNGGLDKYLDILTKKQMLYLYKNIKYIRKNAGKGEVFEELVKNLMTDIGLPLATYDIKHNIETVGPDGGSHYTYFVRRPINYLDVERIDDKLPIIKVLDKQDDVASLNKKYKPDEMEYLTDKARHAPSELHTKVMESDVLDVGEGSPYTKERSLIDYWFYLSSKDMYTSYVTISNPVGTEDISLVVKDAAILALYCALKSQNIIVDYIPVYNLKAVRRTTMPTWEQVRALAPREVIPDGFIDIIMDNNIEIKDYSSTPAFRETAIALHDRLQVHRIHTGIYGNPIKAVSAMIATMSLYNTTSISLGTGSYDEWLLSKGLDLSDLDADDFKLLYNSIVKECIGRPDDEKTLADIQKGIVSLIESLSSYNIQFITNINEDPIVFHDRMNISPMRFTSKVRMRDVILRNKPRVVGVHYKPSLTGSVDISRSLSARVKFKKPTINAFIDRNNSITATSTPSYSGMLNVGSNRIVNFLE